MSTTSSNLGSDEVFGSVARDPADLGRVSGSVQINQLIKLLMGTGARYRNESYLHAYFPLKNRGKIVGVNTSELPLEANASSGVYKFPGAVATAQANAEKIRDIVFTQYGIVSSVQVVGNTVHLVFLEKEHAKLIAAVDEEHQKPVAFNMSNDVMRARFAHDLGKGIEPLAFLPFRGQHFEAQDFVEPERENSAGLAHFNLVRGTGDSEERYLCLLYPESAQARVIRQSPKIKPSEAATHAKIALELCMTQIERANFSEHAWKFTITCNSNNPVIIEQFIKTARQYGAGIKLGDQARGMIYATDGETVINPKLKSALDQANAKHRECKQKGYLNKKSPGLLARFLGRGVATKDILKPAEVIEAVGARDTVSDIDTTATDTHDVDATPAVPQGVGSRAVAALRNAFTSVRSFFTREPAATAATEISEVDSARFGVDIDRPLATPRTEPRSGGLRRVGGVDGGRVRLLDPSSVQAPAPDGVAGAPDQQPARGLLSSAIDFLSRPFRRGREQGADDTPVRARRGRGGRVESGLETHQLDGVEMTELQSSRGLPEPPLPSLGTSVPQAQGTVGFGQDHLVCSQTGIIPDSARGAVSSAEDDAAIDGADAVVTVPTAVSTYTGGSATALHTSARDPFTLASPRSGSESGTSESDDTRRSSRPRPGGSQSSGEE